jgi:hypothetical protein
MKSEFLGRYMNLITHTRTNIFAAEQIFIVFWCMTPCNVVGGYGYKISEHLAA